MTEEGPRVALEDNDDGKGQESAQEGTEQTDSAKGEGGNKSGWGRGPPFPSFRQQSVNDSPAS